MPTVTRADPRYGKTVLSDGTVEYTYPSRSGAGVERRRYRPVKPEDRKYQKRKPDHPGALMFRNVWFVPLELLSDEARVMPETRAGGAHAARQAAGRLGWERRKSAEERS